MNQDLIVEEVIYTEVQLQWKVFPEVIEDKNFKDTEFSPVWIYQNLRLSLFLILLNRPEDLMWF